MLVRESVQLVAGNGDDVLVTFDKDGTPHNEPLRDATALARRYRALDRATANARLVQREEIDSAHAAVREARRAAELVLETARVAWEEAQRAFEAANTVASETFQTARDSASDVVRAVADENAATRTEIDNDAFTQAEAIIAAREA